MSKYYYLIINEDINSGLLKSQVVAPIDNLKKEEIKIINIHKFFKRVKEENVNIALAIPYKIFMFNIFFFLTPVIAFFYSLVLFFIIKKDSIIIARSYFPTLVAFNLSKIKRIEFIFDSRSLFIDENIQTGRIKYKSLNYNMWKYFERQFVLNAKTTIAVSLKQEEFYKSICSNCSVMLIPCYISQAVIYDNDTLSKTKSKLGFNSDDIVVCYFGSLDDGWNNIDMYVEAFTKIISKGVKILVISQNYNNLIKDNRLNIENLVILNTTNLNSVELSKFMQVCDYGIVLMRKMSDWETRLSVKFVEYLNNGLQVIVGEYVGEAARYSQEYFADKTIIYNEQFDSISLKKKQEYVVDDQLDSFFGLNNFKKIVNFDGI